MSDITSIIFMKITKSLDEMAFLDRLLEVTDPGVRFLSDHIENS